MTDAPGRLNAVSEGTVLAAERGEMRGSSVLGSAADTP